MASKYVLQRPASERAPAPDLDESQRAVVDHAGGPLLVLAGPGTGKTTTLVETIVERIDHRGLDPAHALVLTFSRKAAEEIRSRISARLGRTTTAPSTTTFHSFCYGLVREFQDAESFTQPLQLLSAAEQDSRIQELLVGPREPGTTQWPVALRPALRTHGFARELKAFFDRTRALGLDPDQVARVATEGGRPDWQMAAAFHEECLRVFDAQNLIDYSELVHRALLIASDPQHQARLRERFGLVVVDEYQDTDRSQVTLLKALSGGGGDLIAVGDPDQSIYAFRGADVQGILSFPADFATASGPAPTVALSTTRRFGPAILSATRSIIERIGIRGHLDAQTFERFRHPVSVDPAYGDGEVLVQTFSNASAEADHIALLLRRAHLDDKVPWSDMAVLVRSGRASLPRLQRALIAAGVPVAVAGDEIPLKEQPAVAQLLGALRLAQSLADGARLDDDAVEAFLTGPLCGLDASSLRLLCRSLRRGDSGPGPARSSAALLAEGLVQPLLFTAARNGPARDAADRAFRAAASLRTAAEQAREHEAPERILWGLWGGSGWPRRLETASECGGSNARAAHRDLDSVCVLFDLAARAEVRQRRRRLSAFLDEVGGQQIPADSLSQRGLRGVAVNLMTAHRSKGLQWRLVVVAGVQEGAWPDVRYRGSLLQPDRLTRDGAKFVTTTASLLAEERRLFYVAATRAQERLVVTAVESPSADGEQPSPFVVDLRAAATRRPSPPMRRPEHPLSLRGVIGELRAIAGSADDERVRWAAAERLARLIESGADDAAGAHPDTWWGIGDPTESKVPVRPLEQPLALSGSSLDGLISCPLSWFFGHEAKGKSASTSAQGFGLLVHALAAEVVRKQIPADPVALNAHLDAVWDRLEFAAPWVSVRERVEAKRAIERFAGWHANGHANGREPLAAEHGFEVTIPVGDDAVVLRGSMDRVEVDADGLVRVVDFKTGRSAVTGAELLAHPQLGAYQVAVEHGAVDELLGAEGPGAKSAGSELVHLRIPDSSKTPDVPKTQPQSPPHPDEPFIAYDQLKHASRTVRAEQFAATPSPEACRYCDFRRLCPAQPEGRTIVSDLTGPTVAAPEEGFSA